MRRHVVRHGMTNVTQRAIQATKIMLAVFLKLVNLAILVKVPVQNQLLINADIVVRQK